jgi:hypothetical protein
MAQTLVCEVAEFIRTDELGVQQAPTNSNQPSGDPQDPADRRLS